MAMAAAVVLFLTPDPEGVAPGMMRAAGLVVFAIGLWTTGVVAEHLTALAFFLAAMLSAVAPASVVFSAFHSTALWLVFGGLVISVAVRRSGLGERLAALLARRMGPSYLGVIGGIVAIGTGLAFLMPSTTGRVLVLVPVVVALAGRLGFAPGSQGHTGMVMAATLGTMVAGFGVLPANVPNIVLMGASETLHGISLVYGKYLLLHFPISSALKAVALTGLICLLFSDQPRRSEAPVAVAAPDNAIGRLSLILAAALALWATDFIHHVSPAWIALGAALLCMLPRVGVLPASAFNGEINYSSLFYVAGILGLGAVVAHSGLGDELARAVVETVGFVPGATGRNFAAMVLVTMAVALVATNPGVPAVMTPLAPAISEASGMGLETVLMSQVVGFSIFLLPYQTPPVVVGLHLGGVPVHRAIKVTLLLAAVSLIVLLPLNYLWWAMIGMFG